VSCSRALVKREASGVGYARWDGSPLTKVGCVRKVGLAHRFVEIAMPRIADNCSGLRIPDQEEAVRPFFDHEHDRRRHG